MVKQPRELAPGEPVALRGTRMTDAMADLLLQSLNSPDRRAFYYSGNSAETGSRRLNEMTHWDWTPVRSVGVPGSSTCMFPLALGGQRIETSEGKEWVAGVIGEAAQVRDLELPDVRSGRTGQVLDHVRELADTLPPGERIRMPDVQSPLGVAELLWDGSFYLALVDCPDVVHDLLDKITTFIIRFHLAMKKAAGDRLNAIGFPCVWGDAVGVYVSDDSMSLLSPAMHLEFSVPYLNRIADACGPLVYHSCSWWEPYFDNIHQLRDVRVMNWNPGNSTDPAVIIKEFSGKAVLAPHLVKDMHRDRDVLKLSRGFDDEVAFFAHMLDSMQDHTCMHFWFSNIVQKGDVIERIYDLLDARGHTPASQGMA